MSKGELERWPGRHWACNSLKVSSLGWVRNPDVVHFYTVFRMDATTHGQQMEVHFLLIQEGIMGGNDSVNRWFIASGEYLDILLAWSAVKPHVAVLTLVHPEDYFYKLENWNPVRSQTQKKFTGRKAKLLFVSRAWMLAKDTTVPSLEARWFAFLLGFGSWLTM